MSLRMTSVCLTGFYHYGTDRELRQQMADLRVFTTLMTPLDNDKLMEALLCRFCLLACLFICLLSVFFCGLICSGVCVCVCVCVWCVCVVCGVLGARCVGSQDNL